jgi:hypothetical protein
MERALRAVPDATFMPVLNGMLGPELMAIADKVRKLNITPVISTGDYKLLGALVAGYQAATNDDSVGEIVRLDTAEHPPEEIERLLRCANEINGMVIGDLDFGDDHLVPGTVDEFAHLNLFPELYRQTTGGQLELSCAHGFQVFANSAVCKQVLHAADVIVQQVQKELGEPLTWGFDGAMALAAIATGVPITVIRVKSETTRDRSRQKVAAQFAGALHMCRTYTRIFGG